MVVFPNAKINLGLNVVSRLKNGYHNLETVFYPIPLKDILEIIPTKESKTTFTSSGIDIPSDGNLNLVEKAYAIIQQQYKIPSVQIHLHKIIPIGAGLGGGSSDAAFAINLIDELYGLNISIEEKLAIASSLGADCPFFIENKPKYAEGIGDVFSELNLDLSGYYIWLVNPEIHISTAMAYKGVNPQLSSENLKMFLETQPIEEWRAVVKNDFENSIFESYPEIEKIKNDMYDKGALYASMSGSGSSVFGIFKEKPNNESEEVFSFSNWILEL